MGTAGGEHPTAIECKWSADDFDPGSLQVFRRQHPDAGNVVVAHDVDRPFRNSYRGLIVHFEGLQGLIRRLGA